jgi:hypothetical protein
MEESTSTHSCRGAPNKRVNKSEFDIVARKPKEKKKGTYLRQKLLTQHLCKNSNHKPKVSQHMTIGPHDIIRLLHDNRVFVRTKLSFFTNSVCLSGYSPHNLVIKIKSRF